MLCYFEFFNEFHVHQISIVMKFLKIFAGILVTIVLLFFVVGFFLPKSYTMSRSIVINAPDSVVYTNVADFNNFLKWNPWYKMEPTAKITITGTPSQAGHLYVWNGKKMGLGQMQVLEVKPYKLIDEELKFIKPMEAVSNVKFAFDAVPGGTKVEWTMSGENKTIADKWFGAMMDIMMGKDFENGLQDLKTLSETN